MNKILRFVPLLAAGALASGCNDFDYGVTADAFKQKEYAENFEKVFGTPDPNQDWSMAQSVTVSVKALNAAGSSIRIMTNSQMNPDCKLLVSKTLSDDAFTAKVDVVKGTKMLYVEIKNATNHYLVDGYFPIVDGQVIIEKASSITRAVANPSPCTWALYNDGDRVKDEDDNTVLGSVLTTNVNGATVPCPIVWKDGTTEEGKKNYQSGWDYTLYPSQNFDAKGPTSIGKFYLLSNVEHPWSDARKLADMYPLFYTYKSTVDGQAKDGPFAENKNHIKPYFGETVQNNDGELKLEKDASMLTAGGEVEITYVGKGTKEGNDIGYFYYKKSEEANYLRADGKTLDLDKLNKFVLFQNMDKAEGLMKGTNAYNLSQIIDYSDYNQFQQAVGKAGSGEKYQDWSDGGAWKDYSDNMFYYGTKWKLTYFGDGDTPDAEGTYDFPEGYVIGFFGIRNQLGSDNRHLYCSFANVELNYFNDLPRGATFKYKGKVYMGLEDNTDYDINDVLFEIAGLDETDIPDVTPEDDPDVPTVQKWLIACEDLGGTFDYDFNDIVIGFEKKDVDGTDHLFLQPLAAGGTLPSVISYQGYTGSELKEIHEMLGGVKLNDAYAQIYADFDADQIDLGVCPDDIATALKKLSINVNAQNNSLIVLESNFQPAGGSTPQMLLLPGGWDWPTEGTRITNVYNDFVAWAQDATYTSWTKKSTVKSEDYINNTWGK